MRFTICWSGYKCIECMLRIELHLLMPASSLKHLMRLPYSHDLGML